MDQGLKDKWTAALRSGEYLQGKTFLYENIGNRYCCLGVLCNVKDSKDFHREPNTQRSYDIVRDAVEGGMVHQGHVDKLINMNDIEDKSFKQIADYIDANIKLTPGGSIR